MLSRVSILCFAASYAIVLALEISRLVFRSGVRGAFMVGWAAAGLLAHSIFLYNQAVTGDGPPLSSWRDWFLLAAWFLMIVYLYLIYFHPRNTLGVFMLPLVLGLIGTAWVVSPEPFARQPASQVWGGIHGTSLGLAAAAMLFGFATGLMYLRQERRLKHKIPPGKGLKLPSLEWLEHAAARSLVASMVLLGIGVLTGMVLNLIDRRLPDERLRWFDPLVLGTSLMFFWLLFAVHVAYLFRRARRGKIVACLAVLSFVILAIVLAAGLLLNSRHGGQKGEGGRRKGEGGIANCRLQIANCKSNDAGAMPLTSMGMALRLVSPIPLPPSAFPLTSSAFRLPPSAFPLYANPSRRL
ncbi:MAG: hypothetical protein IT426_07845 [Pirellulales bacterium]|nr:hypothetical protein [Pirellulales bacterium]